MTACWMAALYACCFIGITSAQEQGQAKPQEELMEMSVVVVNPSKTKTQTVPIKMYLPREVTPDAILNPDGLDIEFDSDNSMYYVYKDEVLLKPAETRVFDVEIRDVWNIAQERMDAMADQTRSLVERLKGSDFYEPAKVLEEAIVKSLNTITVTQNDETVSRRSHIGIYRSNLKIIDQVKEDISRLEKQLEIVIASPKPEVLEQSQLKTDSPAKNTTWMIIFIIMLFIGMLGGVFFFTWQTQAHATKNLISEARESAFPAGEHSDAGKE
ncbi:MAG: hypothetical protein A3C36_01855 [Omnitrophica WOR_2 bacterium RIFCSPHIGHO2_02_FULL_52_10]|nr:MAG: hypothetical protein A3C36_01855 [Omnitrophica WOR_2 bacterium RIFCSPHIGHO2_02_FULL_52_10]